MQNKDDERFSFAFALMDLIKEVDSDVISVAKFLGK